MEATSRVVDSMKARGWTTDLRGKVVCLASDLGSDNLGLSAAKYGKMAEEVTMVIHNAWSVNFNQQVRSPPLICL
jgi:thioester reductase-like protein